METIIDAIKTEFINAEYELLWAQNMLFFKHSKYSDYWLLTTEFKLEKQIEIFSQIPKCYQDDQSFEKNLSLIYVQRVNEDLDGLNSDVIEIEQEPHYFKKYVLQYSEDSWCKLCNIISNNNVGSLQELAMRKDIFKELKGDKAFGPYSLLYSMIHKMPFVDIKIKKSRKVIQEFNMSFKSELQTLIDSCLIDMPEPINQKGDFGDEETKMKYENLLTKLLDHSLCGE